MTRIAGTGQAGITYTDNLYNASEDPPPGDPVVESALYVVLAPGVVLSHRRPRSRYELTYTHSFFSYLTSAESDMHGDELAGTAEYVLTRRDALTFGLEGSRSSTASMAVSPTADGRPQPDASATYYSLSGSQEFAHRFSRLWAGRQAIAGGITTATGEDAAQGRRYEATGSLGVSYTLRNDEFGLEWAAMYFYSERVEEETTLIPRSRYLDTGPVARWTHEYDEHWASSASAGVGIRYRPDREENSDVSPGVSLAPPTLGAALNWNYHYYAATLAYNGSTRPDLLTSRVYYSDTVSLDASWRVLPRRRVTVSMNHIVSSNDSIVSPVDVNQGMREPTTYTLSSSAAVTWVPVGMLTLGLHYRHAAEITKGNSEEARRDFQRNQVTLTIGWQYPEFNLSRLNQSPSIRISGGGDEGDAGGSGEGEASSGSSEGSSD